MTKQDNFYYSDSFLTLTNYHSLTKYVPQRKRSPARLNFEEFSQLFCHEHSGNHLPVTNEKPLIGHHFQQSSWIRGGKSAQNIVESDVENCTDTGGESDHLSTSFSRWTRSIRKEDNKLLPNLLSNYLFTKGDELLGTNKDYQCANCVNHNIDINGDNKHETCDNKNLTTSQVSQVPEHHEIQNDVTSIRTGKIINKLSLVGRRRGVLRTMSENCADFDDDFQQVRFPAIKCKSVSFNFVSSSRSQGRSASISNTTEFYFARKRRKNEQTPQSFVTPVTSSFQIMENNQGLKSDRESLSGDEESSSTYTTAEEEDHSDAEHRTSFSDYATPDASVTWNPFTFDSHSLKCEDDAGATSDKEDYVNDTMSKIDSDFENTLTDANLSSSLSDASANSTTFHSAREPLVKELNSRLQSSKGRQQGFGKGESLKPTLVSDAVLDQNEPITVQHLQAVFNCFKQNTVLAADCETLLESLGNAQRREDFQWALHQLGGFNALLFLYARVVEICPEDKIQSKGLALVLTQLRNHPRLADPPAHRQYNLIRFILNSEKCTFGFKTFIQVINFCLSASGLKLIDYQLLDTFLLSSWRILTRVRCKESDAPTGNKCLFECLLTIILDLLEECNSHRDFNVTLLKANGFSQTLLAICYHMIVDENTTLKLMDSARLATLVKSILAEIMAPPDAHVAVALVKYGLYPLLPRDLPPLPRKEDAYFILHQPCQHVRSSPIPNNLSQTIQDAEEANEREGGDRIGSTISTIPSVDSDDKMIKDQHEDLSGESKEDVPEILGVYNNDLNNGGTTSQRDAKNESSIQTQVEKSFSESFQESLLEGVMSILLNALSILPDASFHTVLNPHMNAHLFVAYCSHSSVPLKILGLKLLSAYLTRVKNPIVLDFLKRKGFFLTSLYIQGTPEVAQLVVNICNGFGPLSYPLVISLLYSNVVVNNVIEWIQSQSCDQVGIIPALMSMGLLNSIFNIQAHSRHSKLPKPLQNLLSMVTRFCALHPKEDSWKFLFCPSIESAYGISVLVPRIIQEATEYLRRNKKKDLKKVDSNSRLLWLMERASAAGKMGNHFDKWLLNIFTLHIMEMDEEEEMENWIYFVKKNKKKLNQLFGIFLCRVFAVNNIKDKGKDMELKYHTIRVLLNFCPTLTYWLPKVVKSDEQMERCFTAFVRIFLSTSVEQKCNKLDTHLKTASFHSLISDNGNLTLTLQMANANAIPGLNNGSSNKENAESTVPVNDDEAIENISEQQEQDQSDSDQRKLSGLTIRSKFESILIEAGIMSPTNNFSTFSADFKNFKILLETPTSQSGVSLVELRQCSCSLEKMRTPFLLGVNRNGNHSASSVSGNKHHGRTSTCAYLEVFECVNQYAMEMLVTVSRARTQQEVEVARRICLQDANVDTVKQLINVMEQMVHPKAPWHFPSAYSNFCALDQSEGPGRVRTRLKREHLRVHSRFVMPQYRKSGNSTPPLEYLFLSCTAELKVPLILNEIQYMRFCTRIIPGEELAGEIILTQDHLTFIAEHANFQSENVDVRKTTIKYLMKRRYTLEDRAVEIFLECRSFLFVFKNVKDREEFVSLLGLKHVAHSNVVQFHSVNSSLMETSMTSMTSQWLKGHLSNFEYLMYLNTAAGRTYCDLMQYPVFPFILSKYDSPTLDLWAPQSYRDLRKPMAIQDPSKEEHFISTYNYLKRECDSAPFHYGSHYSNSGIVLHFLVRLPPYTQHFLKYQDGSFDIPDRSFHSIETTWRLASKESNTDFKEAIPEFFYLPEFLQNLQHFDLGVRQNGQRVDDVVLPPWAKGDARLFTLINRQALESNHVRKYLSDWIDLIFGYKQIGKAALQALNIFHPSTYEGFEIDGSGDELLIKARKAMVSTYGQTPKQLFAYPHPRASSVVPEEKCEMEVLDTVWGLRWGNYIGSPACPDLDVINTREYTESINLFETNSRIVFWPENTLILGDSVVGYWNANSIRVKTTIVFNAIGDDITVCVGTTSSIWCGHQSGRISVLKMSPQIDSPKVLERVELVGHYQPIKNIHVNQEFSMAISCAGENYAIVWDTNKYPKIAFNNTIECSEAVDDIYSSASTGDIVLLNRQYSRVTLATINGFVVGTVEIDEKIESVCLSALDPGRNVNVIAVGCDQGKIRFYSTWDMKFLNQLKVLPLASLPIKSLRYSRQGTRLYCLSATEEGAVTVSLSLTTSKDRI